MSRNTVKPVRKMIPDELHPSRKLTAKQYTFAHPKDRTSPRSTPSDAPAPEAPAADPNPEEEQSRPSSPRSDACRDDTALNEPTGNHLRERLIDSHDFSGLGDEEVEILIAHLKEYTKMVASNGDYEEARRSQSLYDDAFQANYHRVHDRTRSNSPRTRYVEARRAQEDSWQTELAVFDAETEDKMDQLRMKHQIEKNEFDLRWHREDTLRRYRKPSSRLLAMWRMEKYLARTSKFSDAEVLKAETEELSRRELSMAQAIANRDYRAEYEKLRRKQQQEHDLLLRTREHWRDVIRGRHRVQKAVFQNKDNASIQRIREAPRMRDAQLPSATTRAPQKKKFAATAISFEYQTVLPFVVSPPDWVVPSSPPPSSQGSQNGGTHPEEEELNIE